MAANRTHGPYECSRHRGKTLTRLASHTSAGVAKDDRLPRGRVVGYPEVGRMRRSGNRCRSSTWIPVAHPLPFNKNRLLDARAVLASYQASRI